MEYRYNLKSGRRENKSELRDKIWENIPNGLKIIPGKDKKMYH